MRSIPTPRILTSARPLGRTTLVPSNLEPRLSSEDWLLWIPPFAKDARGGVRDVLGTPLKRARPGRRAGQWRRRDAMAFLDGHQLICCDSRELFDQAVGPMDFKVC